MFFTASATAQTSSWSIELSGESDATKPQQSTQQAQGDKQGTDKAPFVVKVETPTKTQAELQEAADDRNEKIFFDNESLKLTKILIVIGVLTVLAYAIQCVFLILTLRHAKDTSIHQLRAYIQIVPRSMRGFNNASPKISDPNTPPTAVIMVDNFGQTPAKGVVFRADFFVGPAVLTKDFKIPVITAPKSCPMDVFPGGVSIEDKNKMTGLTNAEYIITKEEHAQLYKGEKSLYVFGEAEYKDVFGNDRKTTFCCFIRLDGNRWHQIISSQITENIPIQVVFTEQGNSFT